MSSGHVRASFLVFVAFHSWATAITPGSLYKRHTVSVSLWTTVDTKKARSGIECASYCDLKQDLCTAFTFDRESGQCELGKGRLTEDLQDGMLAMMRDSAITTTTSTSTTTTTTRTTTSICDDATIVGNKGFIIPAKKASYLVGNWTVCLPRGCQPATWPTPEEKAAVLQLWQEKSVEIGAHNQLWLNILNPTEPCNTREDCRGKIIWGDGSGLALDVDQYSELEFIVNEVWRHAMAAPSGRLAPRAEANSGGQVCMCPC